MYVYGFVKHGHSLWFSLHGLYLFFFKCFYLFRDNIYMTQKYMLLKYKQQYFLFFQY